MWKAHCSVRKIQLYIVKRKRPGSSFCDSKRIFLWTYDPLQWKWCAFSFFFFFWIRKRCVVSSADILCVWVVQPIFKRIYKWNMGKYMMSSKHYPNKLSSKNQTKLDSQTMSATSHSHADLYKNWLMKLYGRIFSAAFFCLPLLSFDQKMSGWRDPWIAQPPTAAVYELVPKLSPWLTNSSTTSRDEGYRAGSYQPHHQ